MGTRGILTMDTLRCCMDEYKNHEGHSKFVVTLQKNDAVIDMSYEIFLDISEQLKKAFIGRNNLN